MFYKKNNNSSNRIVIIGAGEVGFHTAKRLSEENKQVLIIDNDERQLNKIQEYIDVQTLLGFGASPKILQEAKIDDAELILAVTNSDEVNIMACMFAKAMAPDAIRVARIRNPDYHFIPDFLEKTLNISLLVNPEEEISRSISRLITLPGSVEYHEFADRSIRMAGMKITKGPLIDIPLYKFQEVMNDKRVMVGAIYRNNDLIIPSGSDIIRFGDIIHFIYEPKALGSILNSLEQKRRPVHNVCIYGASNIAIKLAKLLEEMDIKVCIIANNTDDCKKLSKNFDSTLILYGDARDRSILEEEKIGEMNAFVAASDNEEANILSCLLAKNLGTELTVACLNKPEYLDLADTVGIDHIASPRIATVDSILHYIRHGNVLSSVSIGNETAETMEIFIEKNSPLCNKKIRELSIPKGILFLSVVQGKNIFVPNGNTIIHENDRVIIISKKERIPDLENIIGENSHYRHIGNF